MKQSCWSCKHCINDYFATGILDCKKQDDMTDDEFEVYYGNNGGENCLYYEESNANNEIWVKHENGYYGKLYGKSSMSIYWGNTEVIHTGFRSINTAYELYELLTELPTFMKNLYIRSEKI